MYVCIYIYIWYHVLSLDTASVTSYTLSGA